MSVETKKCRGECGLEKPLDQFWKDSYQKDGLNSCCIECIKLERKIRKTDPEKIKAAEERKALKELNKELAKEGLKKCKGECGEIRSLEQFAKHPNSADGFDYECKICQKEEREKLENKERKSKWGKEYSKRPEVRERSNANNRIRNKRPDVKAKRAAYKKEKYHNDPLWRLKMKYAASLHKDLKAMKSGKNRREGESSETIRGCTIPEFKEWLERDGKYKIDDEGIHIDHIVPRFLRRNAEELRYLHHYTNQRLIPGIENIKKSAHLPSRDELPPEIIPEVLAIYERAVKELEESGEDPNYFYTRKLKQYNDEQKLTEPIPIMDQIFQED